MIYHIDIWWPSQILTIEGFQYFLTIINYCTQFTWVYLLQAKKNVEQVFHTFYSLIHNQFSVNIKSISDNTPKLAISKFFHDKMIISYNSYVDRPKQNSIVWQKHQHILNVVKLWIFNPKFRCAIRGIVFLLCFISLIGSLLYSLLGWSS